MQNKILSALLLVLCATIITAIGSASTFAADTAATANPTAPPAGTPPPPPSPTSTSHEHTPAVLTRVTAPIDKKPGSSKSMATAGLGSEITITLSAKDAAIYKSWNPTDDNPVTLFLNCLPMKLTPIAVCYDAAGNPEMVRFILTRTPENGPQWRALLYLLQDSEVHAAIGLTNNPKGTIGAGIFKLRIITDRAWFWVAAILIALLFGIIFLYGANTNLLRDLTSNDECKFKQSSRLAGRFGLSARNSDGLERPPFSLGRVQMAFWFAIISASYLFLWLVLGEENSFNSTALTLVGISLGTGLISRSIDAGKSNEASNLQVDRKKLETRQAELNARAQADRTADQQAELVAIPGRIAEIDRQLSEQTVPAKEHVSGGFLNDILSDQNGVSLHRLQMIGWTLVLGLVFIADVRKNLSMPTFDNTLLGLMGISSGAFLGFKLPEKYTVAAPPAPPAR